jgi:ribosomal protein S18 acetylase RimI-like enzyme
MTEEEFRIYYPRFREQILSDAIRTGLYTEAVAKKHVDQDLREFDRDGLATKNNYWLKIENGNTKDLGSLWYSIRGERENQTPYLGDIVIAPEFRRQGIATQALALLEAEIKSRGIKNNMAVHIVGDFNEAAIRLFKSSGYLASAIIFEKPMDA